jgi:hypothetical protein
MPTWICLDGKCLEQKPVGFSSLPQFPEAIFIGQKPVRKKTISIPAFVTGG